MPLLSAEHPQSERQTLDEIFDWYLGMTESLVAHRAVVRDALLSTPATPEPRFVFFTEAEVDQYFAEQKGELDRLTCVNLVGSAEGSIRLDFARRVIGKLTDPLSGSYQAWYATLSAGKQAHPDFDDNGILERLKDAKVLDNNLVGRFRECLKPRHWVAHGRYWAKHANVDRLTPDLVLQRASDLLSALSAFPL